MKKSRAPRGKSRKKTVLESRDVSQQHLEMVQNGVRYTIQHTITVQKQAQPVPKSHMQCNFESLRQPCSHTSQVNCRGVRYFHYPDNTLNQTYFNTRPESIAANQTFSNNRHPLHNFQQCFSQNRLQHSNPIPVRHSFGTNYPSRNFLIPNQSTANQQHYCIPQSCHSNVNNRQQFGINFSNVYNGTSHVGPTGQNCIPVIGQTDQVVANQLSGYLTPSPSPERVFSYRAEISTQQTNTNMTSASNQHQNNVTLPPHNQRHSSTTRVVDSTRFAPHHTNSDVCQHTQPSQAAVLATKVATTSNTSSINHPNRTRNNYVNRQSFYPVRSNPIRNPASTVAFTRPSQTRNRMHSILQFRNSLKDLHQFVQNVAPSRRDIPSANDTSTRTVFSPVSDDETLYSKLPFGGKQLLNQVSCDNVKHQNAIVDKHRKTSTTHFSRNTSVGNRFAQIEPFPKEYLRNKLPNIQPVEESSSSEEHHEETSNRLLAADVIRESILDDNAVDEVVPNTNQSCMVKQQIKICEVDENNLSSNRDNNIFVQTIQSKVTTEKVNDLTAKHDDSSEQCEAEINKQLLCCSTNDFSLNCKKKNSPCEDETLPDIDFNNNFQQKLKTSDEMTSNLTNKQLPCSTIDFSLKCEKESSSFENQTQPDTNFNNNFKQKRDASDELALNTLTNKQIPCCSISTLSSKCEKEYPSNEDKIPPDFDFNNIFQEKRDVSDDTASNIVSLQPISDMIPKTKAKTIPNHTSLSCSDKENLRRMESSERSSDYFEPFQKRARMSTPTAKPIRMDLLYYANLNRLRHEAQQKERSKSTQRFALVENSNSLNETRPCSVILKDLKLILF